MIGSSTFGDDKFLFGGTAGGVRFRGSHPGPQNDRLLGKDPSLSPRLIRPELGGQIQVYRSVL